jgi:predicted PurR-regulated permease PerM
MFKNFLVIGFLALIGGVCLWGLGDALIPLLFSFIMAYLFFPLIKKMEKKGLSRHWSLVLVFLFLTTGFLVSLAVIIPPVIKDARELLQELPAMAPQAMDKIEKLSGQVGYPLDLSKNGIKELISEHLSEFSGKLFESVGTALKKAYSGLTQWLVAILNIFLLPLFFFYFVDAYEKIIASVKSFVPRDQLPRLDRYFSSINRILTGYIRGQLMVALVLTFLYSIGLSLVGLKFGIVVGIFAGIISVIPYAGVSLGFAMALLIGLANFSSPMQYLGIAAVFIVVQILEGFLITPKLVGDRVGLSSLATILSIIIGGNLFGMVGMLFAIPAAALVKEILGELKSEYQRMDFYRS